MDWTGKRPCTRYPDVFNTADQSVLNYALCKQAQDGRISVASDPFMVWPGSPSALRMPLDDILEPRESPFVLHWAGIRRPLFRGMHRGDVLRHYERRYFEEMSSRPWERRFRVVQTVAWDYSLRWSVRGKIWLARQLRRYHRCPG
jgi:hypothetical protein